MDRYSTAERVAHRFFADRYARLLLAMSMSEAKAVLGFPPTSSPSPQEVSKAYKRKSFENHPDRGGDAAKMVEINIAKDVLTGERAPTGPGGRRQPRRRQPDPEWTERDRVKKENPPPPVEGPSFSQAMGSVPGVDWKFISQPAYASDLKKRPEEEGGSYWRYYYGWVAYGQTESHHVWAGIRVEVGENRYGIKNEPKAWEAFHTSAPRKVNLIKLAPKMVKQIISGLSGLEGSMNNKYMVPKKYKVLNGTLTEADVLGGGHSLRLKDAIIGSGAMPEGSAGLKGRKAQIMVDPQFNREKFKAMKASGVRGENHLAYDWKVTVNGKGRILEDDEVDRLKKNYFLSGVFSYDYDKKKNLTRLRGGRMSFGAADAIRLLGEALNPGGLKSQIEAAAEMMTKKAALFASMPLHDLAFLSGEPLMQLYNEALDCA